ncbi:MAG: nucleotidyltransferase, partial [Bacteroidia bacterium]|nr:nucleotidyltransferase [Bacteroidia bacterium]
NEVRYENTMEHGKNYDAKNMMHTFRLLNMAEEIAKENKLHVRRHDRDFLLQIRSGIFEYDDLVKIADEKIEDIKLWYAKSTLPETPDLVVLNECLAEIREKIYS